MAPAQEIHAKEAKKLVELTKMTEGEPGNLYASFMGKLKKISGRKFEQFAQVCSRPILHEQVWKFTKQKFEQEGAKVALASVGAVETVSRIQFLNFLGDMLSVNDSAIVKAAVPGIQWS